MNDTKPTITTSAAANVKQSQEEYEKRAAAILEALKKKLGVDTINAVILHLWDTSTKENRKYTKVGKLINKTPQHVRNVVMNRNRTKGTKKAAAEFGISDAMLKEYTGS